MIYQFNDTKYTSILFDLNLPTKFVSINCSLFFSFSLIIGNWLAQSINAPRYSKSSDQIANMFAQIDRVHNHRPTENKRKFIQWISKYFHWNYLSKWKFDSNIDVKFNFKMIALHFTENGNNRRNRTWTGLDWCL